MLKINQWIEEGAYFFYDEDRFDLAFESEWPVEQDLYRIMAESDRDYDLKTSQAITFLEEHQLWLAIEQCCDQGVWLPAEMRFERQKTCPQEIRDKLAQLVATCEVHVLCLVARIYWLLVRMDRYERTGRSDWRPSQTPQDV